MRTTVTLEPDVAAALQKEATKGGRTFKEIVNSTLRRGLAAQQKPKKRFVQRTWNSGGPSLSPAQIKQILLDEDIERSLEVDRRQSPPVRD